MIEPPSSDLALPDPDHAIGIELDVDPDDRHSLDERLGDQQAIERVAVVDWTWSPGCQRGPR
jgi:hypothetical protein